jgi:hypothetical protein
MKVQGYIVFSWGTSPKFTIECESFYQTKRKFQGTPVYELINPKFGTLEYDSDRPIFYGFGDGLPIEVEEIRGG